MRKIKFKRASLNQPDEPYPKHFKKSWIIKSGDSSNKSYVNDIQNAVSSISSKISDIDAAISLLDNFEVIKWYNLIWNSWLSKANHKKFAIYITYLSNAKLFISLINFLE